MKEKIKDFVVKVAAYSAFGVGLALTIVGLVDHYVVKYPSTFRIGMGAPFCTAFAISDKYALTALHCVLNPMTMVTRTVEAYDENTEVIQDLKVILPRGQAIDIAVLQGDFTNFHKEEIHEHKIELGSQDSYETCGYAYGADEMTCAPIQPYENYGPMYKAKGFFIYGFSGGPVKNKSQGAVVGINTALSDGFIVFTPILAFRKLFAEELE